MISDLRGAFGRADDVGKQHGGEDAVNRDDSPLTGQELGDIRDRVLAVCPGQVGTGNAIALL